MHAIKRDNIIHAFKLAQLKIMFIITIRFNLLMSFFGYVPLKSYKYKQ